MSKLLVNLALLNTKAVVNTYTAVTLPFYFLYQRPWQKLKLAKSFGVRITKDRNGRSVYSRPSPPNLQHPYYGYKTFPEVFKIMDQSRVAIGYREVISEKPKLDSNGNPIKIDDKELTEVELSKDYRWLTVGQVMDRVDTLARGMQKMGIRKGDKVIIYAESGLEWFYICLALNRLNAVVVTLFSTLADSGVLYGLNQSEARYIMTSEDLLPKLTKLSDQTEYLESIVYIPNKIASNKKCDPAVMKSVKSKLSDKFKLSSLEEVENVGSKLPPVDFPPPEYDDIALIMYTSGTTGNPKGVILTHGTFNQSLLNLLRIDEENQFLLFKSTFAAYLPMAHLFGYIINIGFFLSDSKVAFCSPFTLLDSSPSHPPGQIGDIKLIQPQFFATVPLVLERILKEIYRKLNARSPIAAPLFTYLMDYKIRWTSRGFDTPIINRLICRKINEQFGGQLTTIGVSSAPLHERTHALIQAALNVKVFNAYGATEVCGPSHTTHLNDISLGRTGIPYNSVKYYLQNWDEGGYRTTDSPNPRGEIVIGGESVSNGYYKMKEETEKAFYVDEEGTRWFQTGDIGEVFPDGTLKIIDRKKDLTKLANGEFISLGKIEAGLRATRFVENICICTDPYSNEIAALITPNQRAIEELAISLSKGNLSFEEWCEDKQITKHIHESISKSCQTLKFHKKEIPVRICLVKEEWTQANNMLTAAFKLRRNIVCHYYQDKIKQMFDDINQNSQN